MKKFYLSLSLLLIAASASATNAAFTNGTSMYDVVTPSVYGDVTATDRLVGQLYYDVSAGAFKGVNKSGGIDVLSVSGSTGVTSGGTERIERALVTCSTSSSVTSQSGSWLSMGNIVSGVCTGTITGGLFSQTPTCVATPNLASSTGIVSLEMVMNSSTSFSFGCRYMSTGTNTVANCVSTPVNIICMGPR